MMKVTNKVIERAKLKDEEAFAEIFYSYKDVVYAFAKHKLKDEEDAKDCVQEIFQKLYLNIDKYDIPRNNFNAWFMQVVKNHIVDFYRKKNREKFILNENYVSNCKSEEQAECLLEELSEILTEEEYKLLAYRIIYDLKFKEIAALLNMNRETVRRYYQKVIDKSKDYVERILNNER